jgi:hypothetical protein
MGNVDPKYLMDGLMKRGYTPQAAAGMVGNAAQESGFKTGAIGDGGAAMGLWQWNGPRKKALVNFAMDKGQDPASPDLQMDFLHYELGTSYKKTQKLINAMKDPAHAALVFSNTFERPSPKYANNKHRMGAAQAFFKMINPVGEANADETPWQAPKQDAFDHKGFKAFLDKKQQAQPQPTQGFDHDGFKAFLAKKQPAAHEVDPVNQALRDIGGGVIEGAGTIGSNILRLGDAYDNLVGKKYNRLPSHEDRMAGISAANKDAGANADNMLYKGSKLGAEIAGSAGAGGAVAKALPVSNALKTAIASGGLEGAGLATKAAGGAMAGAAQTALVDPENALAGAAIGGALPVGLQAFGGMGKAVGKAIKGAGVSDDVANLAKRAKELGIDIPADRLVNSKPLNAVASSLDYVPFSGRAATEAKMQSQLNRALSRTFGQDSDNVTMSLRKAQDDLGGKFDDVLKANTVKVDDKLLNELASHETTAGNELGNDGAGIIKKQIDEILSKGSGGELDGQAAYNIKKGLDRIGKRNTPEAHYARELKKSLMGALDRSLGDEGAAGFKQLRQQYGNMLSLESLAKNGVEGDVSIARIANMKNIGNKDMQELADISAQFLKGREGMHGAAQRAITGGAVGFAGGGAPALLAAIAAGRGTNALLNSKAAKELLLRQGGKSGGNALSKALVRTAPVAIPESR